MVVFLAGTFIDIGTSPVLVGRLLYGLRLGRAPSASRSGELSGSHARDCDLEPEPALQPALDIALLPAAHVVASPVLLPPAPAIGAVAPNGVALARASSLALRLSRMKRSSLCISVSVRFFGGWFREYAIARTRSFSIFFWFALATP